MAGPPLHELRDVRALRLLMRGPSVPLWGASTRLWAATMDYARDSKACIGLCQASKVATLSSKP